MKKIILFLIPLLILGCMCKPASDSLESFQEETIQAKTFDLDKDGNDDRWVYTFEKEALQEGLTLQRQLEYTEKGDYLNGTLILTFENSNSEPIEYVHEEIIPESFASDKESLIFNINPESITKGSYKTKHRISITDRIKLVTFVNDKVDEWGNRALSKIEEWSGQDLTKYKAGLTAAITASNKADFELKYRLSKIAKIDDQVERETELVKEILKNPHNFLEEDCDAIDKKTNFGLRYAVCKAATTHNWEACHDNVVESHETVERCKFLLFLSYKEQCKNIKDTDLKEECLYEQAVLSNSDQACTQIKDKVRQAMCKAEVTQLIEHCQDLDEEYKGFCCEKIESQESFKECMGEEEEEEEEKEEDTNKKYDVSQWFKGQDLTEFCNKMAEELPGEWKIENSRDRQCTFIQTWHGCENELNGKIIDSCIHKHDINIWFYPHESSDAMKEKWKTRLDECKELSTGYGPETESSCSEGEISSAQSGKQRSGATTHFTYIEIPYKNFRIAVNQHVAPSKDKTNLNWLLERAKEAVDKKLR